jgi:hypothetical protein
VEHRVGATLVGAFVPVFLHETFNATFGVHKLLLARKERVAVRTNFYANVLFGGTGGELVATGTLNRGHGIFGMDAGFHSSLLQKRPNLAQIWG